jgi:hypothetical protein
MRAFFRESNLEVSCHFHYFLTTQRFAHSIDLRKITRSGLVIFYPALVFQQQRSPFLRRAFNRRAHLTMDKFESLPYRSRKRGRDDASDSALFLLPRLKRANHNEDRPQSNANPSSPPTESAEAMTRSLSPDGGVAIDEEGVLIDEEALAGLRDYRHVALSDDDDSSDDCSSDEGSHDDGPPRGRPNGPNQVVEPLQRRKDYPQPQAPRQSGSSP